jgi:hypothetical protein
MAAAFDRPAPEEGVADAMRLTPASEHSYSCAVKSNLKSGTAPEVRKSHSRISCTGAPAYKRMINHEHDYRADCSYHDTRHVHAGDPDETKFGENRVPDDGPMTPRMMSRTSPSPLRFTTLLPMKPAMSPTTSHDKMPMSHLLYKVFLTVWSIVQRSRHLRMPSPCEPSPLGTLPDPAPSPKRPA